MMLSLTETNHHKYCFPRKEQFRRRLYKAMGGFATNSVNLTKLESYIIGGSFSAAQFYVDIEGHPHDDNVRLALEELDFFSSELKILGVYHASEMRSKTESNHHYLK